MIIRFNLRGCILWCFRAPDYQGLCPSLLKLYRGNRIFLSECALRWIASAEPFGRVVKRSFLAPRRAYGLNAFQQAFCLYSGKCEPCSMPQSRVRTIGLAVEGLWCLRAAGGPGYSTLINPPNQTTLVTNSVACGLVLSRTIGMYGIFRNIVQDVMVLGIERT